MGRSRISTYTYSLFEKYMSSILTQEHRRENMFLIKCLPLSRCTPTGWSHTMKTTFRSMVLVLTAITAMSAGCSTSPKTEGDAVKLSANAQAALVGYKAKDASLQTLLDKSVGYAIFPDIGK